MEYAKSEKKGERRAKKWLKRGNDTLVVTKDAKEKELQEILDLFGYQIRAKVYEQQRVAQLALLTSETSILCCQPTCIIGIMELVNTTLGTDLF